MKSKKSKQCCEDEKKALGPAPVPGFGSPTARMTPDRQAAIQATRQKVQAMRAQKQPSTTPQFGKSMYHYIDVEKGSAFDLEAFNRENPVYNGDKNSVGLDEAERTLTRKRMPGYKVKPNADTQARGMSTAKEGEWKSMSKTKKKKCCKGLAGLMNVAKGF